MRLGLPQGLRARLILLVLGAIAAAQAATFALFLDEREVAVRLAAAEEAAAATLDLARALDAATPAARAALAEAARRRGLRFSVSDRPLAAAPGAEPAPRLAARLSASGRTARAALVSRGERREGDAHEQDEHEERDDDERGEDHRRAERLALSVALESGGWLNAEARLRPPPPQWAGPALVSAGLAALAVGAVVWVAIGRIAAPMRALAVAADQLGRGERPEPLAVEGPAEVRAVAEAFNGMSERLTRLLAERARTLGAVGHDLRSPLTAMRLRLEMVDDEETRERLSACVDEMQALVEGALALARGGGAEEPFAETDLRALAETLAAELREGGGRAEVAPGGPVMARARPLALRRALRNVAENAVRYGGAARIALAREGAAVLVTVDDDGPGVPAPERARVFEPFVRLDASRSRDTGGAGLGLAIARAAIEGMGGTIAIGDAPSGGGARVTITLKAD